MKNLTQTTVAVQRKSDTEILKELQSSIVFAEPAETLELISSAIPEVADANIKNWLIKFRQIFNLMEATNE